MANYKKWSAAERGFIKDNAETMTDREIAARMSKISGENVTSDMVRQQRRKENVKKSRGRPRKKGSTDNININ